MQVQASPIIRRTSDAVFVDSTKSGGLLLPCLFGQTPAQVRLGYEARSIRVRDGAFKAVHKNTDAIWWAATASMTTAEFKAAAFAYITSIQ